ncbi:hypothetical protein [Prevotella fusca]|uniref:hypothetical protein n=1 Tax=Prevotella fusca TaxID=589436 RepID=UPI003F70175A
MKKLRTIIRWVIWTIAGLYITTIVLLHIPAVQASLAHKVADIAGGKLGTEVHVGRIDLGFINRFVLDDILIYDQSHKKMLSASRSVHGSTSGVFCVQGKSTSPLHRYSD